MLGLSRCTKIPKILYKINITEIKIKYIKMIDLVIVVEKKRKMYMLEKDVFFQMQLVKVFEKIHLG